MRSSVVLPFIFYLEVVDFSFDALRSLYCELLILIELLNVSTDGRLVSSWPE